MRYHKSPVRKWKKQCLGIYYDYRKTITAFCCYSLLGTCLILCGASALQEEKIFYQLSDKENNTAIEQTEALAAETASSSKQNIYNTLHKITSQTVTYSLTGTISGLSKETEQDISKNSQKEAGKDTADTAEKESKEIKNTKKKTSPAKKENKTNYDISEFSNKELHILERIVEAEAGDQTLKGRIMVAHVVLNRVASDEFPNTIKSVVFQNNSSTYQFSPVKDGRYYEVTISKKTKKAVAKAFELEDLTDGALYFMSRSGSSKKNIKWFDSSLTRITSYGCHEFFK